MDWDIPYVIAPTLTLKASPAGKLVQVGSPAFGLEIDPEALLPVLLAFAAGSPPREALARLQQEWELDEAGFERVVGGLVDRRVLVDQRGLGVASASKATTGPSRLHGFGSVRTHLPMLRDPIRVLSYRSAIERHARGKTVVEIGCGTGILSLFAARAGARRVIAIEETAIADVARRMFEVNGYSDVIEVRNANSLNVELEEPADLIIHEILGVDPLDENLLPVLEDARRRLLRPGGRLLPYRVEICCAGIQLEEPEEDRILAEARELPRLYGFDFEPFLETLARSGHDPVRRWKSGKTGFEPAILSEENRFLDVDLREDRLDLAGLTAQIPLRIVRSGTFNGIVLFFRAHLDEDTQLTNSPLAPATCWGWDVRRFPRQVRVSPGDEVAVGVKLEEEDGVQGLSFDLA